MNAPRMQPSKKSVDPEIQAILNSAPRYMIARAIQEWQKDQEKRHQNERLSQAMRDMHSLQIPPPPRVTCEEVPEEPTKKKIQLPGRWSTSNQKKRLIQAIKRRSPRKQVEQPQTKVPTPDEQAYAALLQAETRRTNSEDVYISARKSMTVRFYIHSRPKRTEALALVVAGATENFMNMQYAKYLQL